MPVTFNYAYISDQNYEKACKLWSIAEENGEESPRAAAIQFALCHPGVGGVIIGASSPEQLVDLKQSIERRIDPKLYDDLIAAGIVDHDSPLPES
jgi:D-threo-aldose 1-dehydrogenase